MTLTAVLLSIILIETGIIEWKLKNIQGCTWQTEC